MNRRIRKELKTIREACDVIEADLQGYSVDDVEKPEEISEEVSEDINLTSEPEVIEPPPGLYLEDIKRLSSLKDITIKGQVTKTFDLKSYINKTTQAPGLIYRFVLTDPKDEITVICFDDMAKEFKKYPIGTHLRITNMWKIQDNKHGIPELHVGNYAKVEVVE